MKRTVFFTVVVLALSSLAKDVCVVGTVAGEVSVSVSEPGDWKLTASQETADGVSVVTVRLVAPESVKPPKFTVSFASPGIGADHVWTPYDDRYWIRPYEWGATPYESQLAFRAPLAAAFRANGENVLSLACSEAFDALKYGLTIGSSDCRLHGELAFFTEYAVPRASYEAKIRIDARKVRWSQNVSEAADWVSETAGLTPCAVPAAARDPMYSTWYAFWQDVKADVLEREAPLAASLGMKAMILDDGWQKEKSRTYYSATGDWMPVEGRFPDMKAHVAKIHAAGLKYILWLSVPFVGDESVAYARFKDKFLCEPDSGSGTYVLDVRFPEVREYLIATYERAVRDWGFDGLKLDFIDLLKIPATGDPAEKDNWKGRDIRSLPVAVDTLMKDVRRRLMAINPEVLIEFRQQYMGPAIRQYGNMIRATDCPADSDKIRKLVCDLRLTSGTTAVHSDMLVWHPDETPERAARPILNSLFSTIQYSMVLARLPESHRGVIRHWLAFTQAHRATLLDGAFLPEHPEALYPLVAAESASERIAAAYTVGTVVSALAGGKPAWAINATDAEGLVVDAAADGTAEIFDTFGRSRGKVAFARGLVRLAVPPSGYAALCVNDAAKGIADTEDILKTYVRRFNEKDVELYTNAFPNAEAEAFMLANCPRFACSDKDIERTYYFRWWTFRKHLRHDLGVWTVSEFLPKVGWSGAGNTIVCPAGHHLREGRWLRDPKYATETARFWLADGRAVHRWNYSSWLFTGACAVAEVTGDERLPVELLDAAVAYYRRWERGFMLGECPMGGDGKGGFLSVDHHEGTEISLGGNGYKPLFGSAMWSEANRIAQVAGAAGRDGLAAEFADKAEVARQALLKHCWNPEVGFFTTGAASGLKGVVRELHGYAPWYFGLPTDGRAPDWTQLSDPQGFAARFGLSFPERRAKGFVIDYEGHECKWNGPSWPFATSIALTALANDLHARASAPDRGLFGSLLRQYAAAQVRRRDPETEGDLEVVPWIDENLHPDKAEWISREIIRRTPQMAKRFPKERGKDYNHSTFCDLVITGLVGFMPKPPSHGSGAPDGFIVDPLFPTSWDHLVLENLRYRGHDVDIRWRQGEGLVVSVDGREAARRATLGLVDIEMK